MSFDAIEALAAVSGVFVAGSIALHQPAEIDDRFVPRGLKRRLAVGRDDGHCQGLRIRKSFEIGKVHGGQLVDSGAVKYGLDVERRMLGFKFVRSTRAFGLVLVVLVLHGNLGVLDRALGGVRKLDDVERSGERGLGGVKTSLLVLCGGSMFEADNVVAWNLQFHAQRTALRSDVEGAMAVLVGAQSAMLGATLLGFDRGGKPQERGSRDRY